ncbi:MAG: DUF72 domain-containing protein [Blastocatellia bacterium]|nr:DUF72 domain-containing protein [Blastocatellia bacterium]
MTRIHIGAQGWNYKDWIGPFYPRGTPDKDMLRQYARVFDTVEIDSTFYAIPSEHSVRLWIDRTPEEFTFSVKLPSEITHKNRLRDSAHHLASFLERMRLMGEKLGCVLIQLPPDFSPAERRSLDSFLQLLPSDIRFAVEFRDPAWIDEVTLSELKKYNVALTLADSKWIDRSLSLETIENPTAPFAYVRWLGPRELTDFSRVQIDRSQEFKQWADAFQRLTTKVSTIFGYFNNHYQGHSPASCNEFKTLIGLPAVDPDALVVQPSLFS